MLKYTIFRQGYKRDENKLRCPNCFADDTHLKGNSLDSVYTCTKCICRFHVEDSNIPIKPYKQSNKVYNLTPDFDKED